MLRVWRRIPWIIFSIRGSSRISYAISDEISNEISNQKTY
jgi:hypothetical protein